MKILSTLLIIFGILWCLLGGYYYWLKNSPNQLRFEHFEQKQTVSKTIVGEKKIAQPTRVIIKDLNIDLPLFPSRVNDNIWETTYQGASYLASSPLPGTKGNSIIYAHNWTSLFGPILNAKIGEKIEIVFADGSKKTFIISSISKVQPSESSVLNESQDKRITLYTCAGFLDSQRFVVVALYDEKQTVTKVAAN